MSRPRRSDLSDYRPRLAVISALAPSRQTTNGFAARLYHFLAAAAEQMDTTWVRVALTEEDPSAEVPVERSRVIPTGPAPWSAPTLAGRLRRALIQYPFDRLPFDCYPRESAALRTVLADERPDVVVLYLPYLAHLADHAPSGVPVIGLLEEAWEGLVAASLEGTAWKKAWLSRREAARYARVYRGLDRRASAVVAISEAERSSFARTIKSNEISVIPNGVDTAYFASRGEPGRDIDVLVVGDLRSPRNYVGALRAWEAARSEPSAQGWRWAFVGAVASDVAHRLRDGGATVTGVVGDIRPYYERANAVLVPAVAGTGVKSTSIQAWAMNRPLVASPTGAQGLPATPSENILVGEDEQMLVAHIKSILADPVLAKQLAEAGRRTAERYCDLPAIGRQFARLCVETARQGREA